MIGVLAIQGGFAEHERVLDELNLAHRRVNAAEDLKELRGLIVPGGESTVMIRFLREYALDQAICKRAEDPHFVIYGTCAGLIVLAKTVDHLPFPPLGILDLSVERNAYGRQSASFITDLNVNGLNEPLPAHFIRAPKISWVGSEVQVLAEHQGKPVLVRQGSVWGSTFHPELAPTSLLHREIFCFS